ncbi:ABC transporter ATP-binding protein [Antarcticirhabdus aurantiaca]|uniref:ABC transporter ATP-binding protein n=1 Tax=Antarcticirhabdus aurantiaca TaxID=2606717 RepID=A0ACD4NKG6_9HYPH|nr:ABC transporter ATP-binding protein [Antarcticirhabdus aurantiaca]WAJ27281.1 ABC transporter ATP-binding protein [Jeongeuplla avenae]
MSDPILVLSGVSKTYKNGFEALKGVDLSIRRGEIFALLGPNGAGKTTLISAVCGIVSFTGGTITVGGHDNRRDYKAARAMIGLVPQELTTDAFETVWDTVSFTRGLFGKPRNDAVVERTLRDLSLWEKKDSKIMTLSGGMKRRVLIAKALAHEPELLFLDEPTAGVDVTLRRDMWEVVRRLRENGTTIILTTHYIEEAEEMADRVGVIARGQLLLVEEKSRLMEKLGHKELILTLDAPLSALPPALDDRGLHLGADGTTIVHTYDTNAPRTGIATLIADLSRENIRIRDLETRQSSLEEIFVGLVSDNGAAPKEARS